MTSSRPSSEVIEILKAEAETGIPMPARMLVLDDVTGLAGKSPALDFLKQSGRKYSLEVVQIAHRGNTEAAPCVRSRHRWCCSRGSRRTG
jgi:hypothetical protein